MSMVVVRCWKRDATMNLMDLQAAAANLASNDVMPQAEASLRLAAGQQLETPLAVFRAVFPTHSIQVAG